MHTGTIRRVCVIEEAQVSLPPGQYNIHSMTLYVREDGVRVLRLAVAEPGQTRSLALVETVLTGPPPTAEATVAAEAATRSLRCLHAKYGENDPTVANFIADREARLGTEAWTPYYWDDPHEGASFVRDWLIKDFEEFTIAQDIADIGEMERVEGGNQ
jgi:hypothetical protein